LEATLEVFDVRHAAVSVLDELREEEGHGAQGDLATKLMRKRMETWLEVLMGLEKRCEATEKEYDKTATAENESINNLHGGRSLAEYQVSLLRAEHYGQGDTKNQEPERGT